ncbi:MAG: diacylglycerol kinase family lipid kinase [Armatimonas sp.]
MALLSGKGSLRAVLLSNTNSGPAAGSTALDQARKRLGERLGRWQEITLRPGEDLLDLAHEAAATADVVLVAGGDGTVRAVAKALQNSGVPIALIPFGTVNVLARELGIPIDDPATAVDVALDGVATPIDIGLCNGEPFLLVCSGGVDSATVAQVNTDIKSAVGATAYAMAAVGALATFTPPRVRIRIDGQELPETDVFLFAVGNTSLYGGDLRLLPGASIYDGLLDVAVFLAPTLPTPVRNAAFLPQLASVALGRHPENDTIHLYRGKEVIIESDKPIPLQMDGDLAGETPAKLTIAPGVLRVMTPETPPQPPT